MEDLFTGSPREIVFFYAIVIVGALYFLFRKRPRPGMLLRLRERTQRWRDVREAAQHRALNDLKRPLVEPQYPAGTNTPEHYSHIQPVGERPVNVVFNYNGHSWDAYEVLGLPAGSSPDKVDEAYSKALKTADPVSRGFLAAAHAAIQTQWRGYKKFRLG